MLLYMTLRDSKSGNVIATEKMASLEDDEGKVQLGESMLSWIEMGKVDSGEYDLEILVDK